jgi:hypothetical protein
MGSVTRDRLGLFLFRNNVGGERLRGRRPTNFIVQRLSRNGKPMDVLASFSPGEAPSAIDDGDAMGA